MFPFAESWLTVFLFWNSLHLHRTFIPSGHQWQWRNFMKKRKEDKMRIAEQKWKELEPGNCQIPECISSKMTCPSRSSLNKILFNIWGTGGQFSGVSRWKREFWLQQKHDSILIQHLWWETLQFHSYGSAIVCLPPNPIVLKYTTLNWLGTISLGVLCINCLRFNIIND